MFDSKNFSVMSYANGFTLWNYSTKDTLTQVKAAGYFNETSPFARRGDMILINASVASSLEPAILSVSSNAEGVVTVAAVSPVTTAPVQQSSEQ